MYQTLWRAARLWSTSIPRIRERSAHLFAILTEIGTCTVPQNSSVLNNSSSTKESAAVGHGLLQGNTSHSIDIVFYDWTCFGIDENPAHSDGFASRRVERDILRLYHWKRGTVATYMKEMMTEAYNHYPKIVAFEPKRKAAKFVLGNFKGVAWACRCQHQVQKFFELRPGMDHVALLVGRDLIRRGVLVIVHCCGCRT